MISREALSEIKELEKYMSDNRADDIADMLSQVIPIIEKDLQLLEILKVYWNKITHTDFNQNYFQYLLNYGIPHTDALTKEVYNLVKEWLEK